MINKNLLLAGAVLALTYGGQVVADDAALTRGEEVYDDCSICHGDDAEGGEDYGAPKLAGQLDWYLIRQLQNFRDEARGTNEGDEYGPVMQPMATDLDDQAIDDVVAYIMTLDASIVPDED